MRNGSRLQRTDHVTNSHKLQCSNYNFNVIAKTDLAASEMMYALIIGWALAEFIITANVVNNFCSSLW